MDGSFAFELPLMHVTFGITFLIAARWRERSALYFGFAFLFNAAGFGLPVMPMGLSSLSVAWVTDILFAFSFFCFGQAAAEHFRRSRFLLRTRLALCLLSITLCMTSVIGFDDLHAELVASDAGCVVLLGLPLVGIGWAALRNFDRSLLAAAWLLTMESVVRGASSFFTAPSDVEAFDSSRYAFFMQAMGSVFGVVFAMAGLAAVALSVLERTHRLAMSDPLSGLLNRRGFEEAMAAQASRGGCIVACDIDRFKALNDRYGHARGDGVIAAFARIVEARLPEGSVAARFGGEEFVLFLPSCGPAQAMQVAEAVRAALAAEGGAAAGLDAVVTASLGVSDAVAADYSIHDAIARADAALYEAKSGGRNCVAMRLAGDETVLPVPAGERAVSLVA